MSFFPFWLCCYISHPLLVFFCLDSKNPTAGTSLVVQWLRLCASTAGGVGSIPGRGTKTPHDAGSGQKKFFF